MSEIVSFNKYQELFRVRNKIPENACKYSGHNWPSGKWKQFILENSVFNVVIHKPADYSLEWTKHLYRVPVKKPRKQFNCEGLWSKDVPYGAIFQAVKSSKLADTIYKELQQFSLKDFSITVGDGVIVLGPLVQ